MNEVILDQKTKNTFIPYVGEVFYDKSNKVLLKCKESKEGGCIGCWYFNNTELVEKNTGFECLGNCTSSKRECRTRVIYSKQQKVNSMLLKLSKWDIIHIVSYSIGISMSYFLGFKGFVLGAFIVIISKMCKIENDISCLKNNQN